MEARDLMVDDYALVYPSMKLIKIVAIHKKKVAYHSTPDKLTWVRMDLLRPIPLIKEILKQNGFVCSAKESEKEICYERWSFQDKLFSINIEPDLLFIEVNSGGKNGDAVRYMNFYANSNSIYLHELQNILSLCKVRKEIVP